MGLQSVPLFLLTLGVSIVGIVIYWIGVFLNKKKLIIARELEDGFMKSFIDILAGFKEIHMNPKIGQDIFNKKIRNISNESYLNNTKAFTGFLNIQITGEVLFYSLIAFILLYSSYFVDQTPASIVNFVFILLYLLGSLNSIMLVIPQIVSARISSGKISKLRAELSDERFENYIETAQMSISEFKELKVNDLSFNYGAEKTSAKNFGVGPLSFSIKKGESIFIYGGNGSGKTTMINVILGILKMDTGKIEFNDTVLDSDNYGNYRSLFSVVFSDFYLFDEVYGIENIDGKLIEDYLEMFELTDKVTFNGNSFSSSDLSTGQRKRLALINVLIRSKPILVLDEWAADQDPVFRRKFYTEIIPQLKERGFTILAITHDDAYYHLADKLYKMNHGSLSIETIESESK
jgi:putative ATP-binding cassette transporter